MPEAQCWPVPEVPGPSRAPREGRMGICAVKRLVAGGYRGGTPHTPRTPGPPGDPPDTPLETPPGRGVPGGVSGGVPGGPGGQKSAHFFGYLIILPVGTEFRYIFFNERIRILVKNPDFWPPGAPPGTPPGTPPSRDPLGYPPKYPPKRAPYGGYMGGISGGYPGVYGQ